MSILIPNLTYMSSIKPLLLLITNSRVLSSNWWLGLMWPPILPISAFDYTQSSPNHCLPIILTSSYISTFISNRSQVQGSTLRVKDKEGIEDPKSSLKMLIFPSNCQFGFTFWIRPDEDDAFFVNTHSKWRPGTRMEPWTFEPVNAYFSYYITTYISVKRNTLVF